MNLESELGVGPLVEKEKKLMGEKRNERFERENSILMKARKGELGSEMEGRVLEWRRDSSSSESGGSEGGQGGDGDSFALEKFRDLIFTLFCAGGNWSTERWSDMSEITLHKVNT